MSEPTEMPWWAGLPWRVGRHYAIHIYAGDTPIATALTPEYAAQIVADHNAALAARNSANCAGAAKSLSAESGGDT